MKIRSGFVSNSSSSSFVVIGVKRLNSEVILGEYDDVYEAIENEDLGKGISSLWVEGSNYDYITGFVICDGDEIEENTISFSELNDMAVKVSKALNVDVSKVELITGVRSC